jgi:hypothetical protein
MFNAVEGFPTISPIVSFTGPVVGAGQVLLHDEPVSGLSETQRKCCGFVQLSTFITAGGCNEASFPRITPIPGLRNLPYPREPVDDALQEDG